MFTIRSFTSDDTDAIVDFSLRAWEPVFDSMANVVGPELFVHLFTADWRQYQAADIRRALSTYDVSVAEVGNSVAGFVAIALPEGEGHGEIYMIAVDPDHQAKGVGSALTRYAVEQIRAAGRKLVVVETGGDPGHAPARSTYENAGFVSLPAERYYLAL